MRSFSNKKGKLPVNYIATAYIHTMCFDMAFHFISETVEPIKIPPGAPRNFESETCYSIPYVCYQYIKVSKTEPNRESGEAMIDQVMQKIKAYASAGSKQTIIHAEIQMQPVKGLNLRMSQESFNCLSTDPIAMTSKSTDFPKIVKVTSAKPVKKKR